MKLKKKNQDLLYQTGLPTLTHVAPPCREYDNASNDIVEGQCLMLGGTARTA
jgi:hypothetical protein